LNSEEAVRASTFTVNSTLLQKRVHRLILSDSAIGCETWPMLQRFVDDVTTVLRRRVTAMRLEKNQLLVFEALCPINNATSEVNAELRTP
jgi:hypothetical protein